MLGNMLGRNQQQGSQQSRGILAGLGGGGQKNIGYGIMKFTVADSKGTPLPGYVKIFGQLGIRPIAEGDTWEIHTTKKGSTAVQKEYSVPKGRHPYEVTIKGCTGSQKGVTWVMDKVDIPITVQLPEGDK